MNAYKHPHLSLMHIIYIWWGVGRGVRYHWVQLVAYLPRESWRRGCVCHCLCAWVCVCGGAEFIVVFWRDYRCCYFCCYYLIFCIAMLLVRTSTSAVRFVYVSFVCIYALLIVAFHFAFVGSFLLLCLLYLLTFVSADAQWEAFGKTTSSLS